MIGAFAVGKTSLVKRFVKGIFSESYLTTVGVKIDKREVEVEGQVVNLLLWDIHGEDEFQKLRLSHLRGMSGYLLVIDQTRGITLANAVALQKSTEDSFGKLPFLLVCNKHDLKSEADITESQLDALREQGWKIVFTSAKTGEGVEEMFHELTREMLAEMSTNE